MPTLDTDNDSGTEIINKPAAMDQSDQLQQLRDDAESEAMELIRIAQDKTRLFSSDDMHPATILKALNIHPDSLNQEQKRAFALKLMKAAGELNQLAVEEDYYEEFMFTARPRMGQPLRTDQLKPTTLIQDGELRIFRGGDIINSSLRKDPANVAFHVARAVLDRYYAAKRSGEQKFIVNFSRDLRWLNTDEFAKDFASNITSMYLEANITLQRPPTSSADPLAVIVELHHK